MCVSIDEEVVHGIPSKEKFIQEGDIVSLDIGVIHKGYHSDAARTHAVGEISKEAALERVGALGGGDANVRQACAASTATDCSAMRRYLQLSPLTNHLEAIRPFWCPCRNQ